MTDAHETTLIPELDAGGLRRFGITTGAIVAGLFGALLPFVFDLRYPRWPWVVAMVLIVWALLAPASLRGVYRGWMRLGLLLNRVVSPVVLGIVYFLIVTPLGLIMRLAGRDPMAPRSGEDAKTCRMPSEARDSKHMEHPY